MVSAIFENSSVSTEADHRSFVQNFHVEATMMTQLFVILSSCRITPHHREMATQRLPSVMRNCLRLAGLSGSMAIGLGVYGAHFMKGDITEEQKRVEQIVDFVFSSTD